MSEAGTKTTEREGGTENDGVADFLGSVESALDGGHSGRLGSWDFNLVQGLDEEITVLRDLEGTDRSSQNLHAQSLEHTHLVELDTDVKGGLTTESQQDTIWALLLENVGDVVGRDGQEVDLGRKVVRGLDSSDVGVDEDGVDVALAEGLDGL